MKRAGQHAMIHWIKDHLAGEVAFHNDIGGSNKIKTVGPCSNIIFNIEDFEEVKHAEINPTGVPIDRTIYVYRDPLNMFASRKKASTLSTVHKLMDWFSGESFQRHNNLLVYAMDNGYTTIDYGQWIECEVYRDNIGKELGLVGDYKEKYMFTQHQGSSSWGRDSKIQETDNRVGNLTDEEIELIKKECLTIDDWNKNHDA